MHPFPHGAGVFFTSRFLAFPGLKTAVKYFLRDQRPDYVDKNRPLICKSLQTSIVSALTATMKIASQQTGITTVAVVGGVACNGYLRETIAAAFQWKRFFPFDGLMHGQRGHDRACRFRSGPKETCSDPAPLIRLRDYSKKRRQKSGDSEFIALKGQNSNSPGHRPGIREYIFKRNQQWYYCFRLSNRLSCFFLSS